MEMTTYDMERRAAMPSAAPVGAVGVGHRLAAPNPLQVHGTFAPVARKRTGISVMPWTTGYDRQVGRLFGHQITGRPARRLGRSST
jgi:hypothetical protein